MVAASGVDRPGVPLPRESANAMLHRLVSRRPPVCYLIGKGYRVQTPHCALCAKELDLPDRKSETFMLAAPMANAKPSAPANGSSTWLFFGTKVLVAAVSTRLAPLLEASVALFGEKVLVAMPPWIGRKRTPYLFCFPCGQNVLAKVSGNGGNRYCWDWLAEMEPRDFGQRWRTALRAIDPGLRRATHSMLSQLSGLWPVGGSDRPPSIPALEAPHHAATGADNRSS